eukprot:1359940-Pyramimonas_sp.AAC.1
MAKTESNAPQFLSYSTNTAYPSGRPRGHPLAPCGPLAMIPQSAMVSARPSEPFREAPWMTV